MSAAAEHKRRICAGVKSFWEVDINSLLSKQYRYTTTILDADTELHQAVHASMLHCSLRSYSLPACHMLDGNFVGMLTYHDILTAVQRAVVSRSKLSKLISNDAASALLEIRAELQAEDGGESTSSESDTAQDSKVDPIAELLTMPVAAVANTLGESPFTYIAPTANLAETYQKIKQTTVGEVSVYYKSGQDSGYKTENCLGTVSSMTLLSYVQEQLMMKLGPMRTRTLKELALDTMDTKVVSVDWNKYNVKQGLDKLEREQLTCLALVNTEGELEDCIDLRDLHHVIHSTTKNILKCSLREFCALYHVLQAKKSNKKPTKHQYLSSKNKVPVRRLSISSPAVPLGKNIRGRRKSVSMPRDYAPGGKATHARRGSISGGINKKRSTSVSSPPKQHRRRSSVSNKADARKIVKNFKLPPTGGKSRRRSKDNAPIPKTVTINNTTVTVARRSSIQAMEMLDDLNSFLTPKYAKGWDVGYGVSPDIILKECIDKMLRPGMAPVVYVVENKIPIAVITPQTILDLIHEDNLDALCTSVLAVPAPIE